MTVARKCGVSIRTSELFSALTNRQSSVLPKRIYKLSQNIKGIQTFIQNKTQQVTNFLISSLIPSVLCYLPFCATIWPPILYYTRSTIGNTISVKPELCARPSTFVQCMGILLNCPCCRSVCNNIQVYRY